MTPTVSESFFFDNIVWYIFSGTGRPPRPFGALKILLNCPNNCAISKSEKIQSCVKKHIPHPFDPIPPVVNIRIAWARMPRKTMENLVDMSGSPFLLSFTESDIQKDCLSLSDWSADLSMAKRSPNRLATSPKAALHSITPSPCIPLSGNTIKCFLMYRIIDKKKAIRVGEIGEL